MCGPIQIDGYAFCLGLKSLLKSRKLSYMAYPELESLPSLTNLIEQAGLRPKHIKNSLERYSLEICSLAELVDMFYTRQASDPRDKVYALLGMSLGDPSKASLQPNYTISWEELFAQLIKYILGGDVFVKTSGQRAVIKSKGRVLGQVSSIRRDNRQNVNIIVNERTENFRPITTEWTLQAPAKPIQEYDIIYLQYGASKPTIIRVCKDHFAVIVIAATPLNRSSSSGWPETSQSRTEFSRDFLLIWDWESPQGMSQDQGEYDALIKIYSQALQYPKAEFGDYLHEAMRFWNDIMILDDLGEDEIAEERLSEARSRYVIESGKECLPRLHNDEYGRTLLSFAAGEGHEDIVKLLLKIGGDPEIKDGKSGRAPLWWAAQNGHEAVVKLLLETRKVEADPMDKYGQTPLWCATQNGHEAITKLLLETSRVEADLKDNHGQTPLCLAARHGHEAIVKLLLETSRVEADSRDNELGQTPLTGAAQNGHEAIVKLLLETGKVNADSRMSMVIRRCGGQLRTGTRPSSSYCSRLARSTPTQMMRMVRRRCGGQLRTGTRPSSSYCSRLARSTPTQMISVVRRRCGGQLRTAMRPSSSCCSRLAKSRSAQRIDGVRRRCCVQLRTGTRPSSSCCSRLARSRPAQRMHGIRRRCCVQLGTATRPSSPCCSRRARLRSTRKTMMVGRRSHWLLRRGTRPSSGCCSRRARLTSTRKTMMVGRRSHGLLRTGTRSSSSCCSRRVRLRPTRKKMMVGRRSHELLRTGTRSSSSCCSRRARLRSTRETIMVGRRSHGLP